MTGSNVDTNKDGNIFEVIDYYPFGSVRVDESYGGYENDYKYTGKELDEDTGLYYYGARYYDAEVGRFASADQLTINVSKKDWLLEPQKLNGYSYAYNNPLRYTDPTGLYGEDVHYDLTFYLGQKSGLSYDQSKNVAYYDQNVDDNPATNPQNFKNILTGITSKYHFASRSDATNRIVNSLNSCMDEEATIKEFGASLHTYQDTYSHSSLNLLSHGILLKLPDTTNLNEDQAFEMARNSFILQRELNAKLNGTGDMTKDQYSQETKKIWGDIKDDVSKYLGRSNKSKPEIYYDAQIPKRNEQLKHNNKN